MSRPDNRQHEMLKNAEHLHTLAVMETVLDDELDRLESEHDWYCRKYVYLQALESDSVHLRRVAISIQKSRSLIDMLRSLLEDTFEEKLIFMSEVRDQQLQWRMEDSHMSNHSTDQQHHHHPQQHHHHPQHHHHHSQQHHHHSQQRQPMKRKFHSNICTRFPVKGNKKFTMSVKMTKSQKSCSKLISLTCHSQMSINLSKKCKESVKLYNRSKSEVRKTRKCYGNKKSNISQMQHLKTSQICRSHYVDTRQELEPDANNDLQFTLQEQNNVLSNITNEITHYRQMISDSPVMLLPAITNQPIGMEDFRQGIRRHIWRCERSRPSDLFCFGLDTEDETLLIERVD